MLVEFTIQTEGELYSYLEQICEDNPLIFSRFMHLQVWLLCGTEEQGTSVEYQEANNLETDADLLDVI